ncbi:MAG: ribosome maturation factor, partial [Pseudomonadota bacterium]
GVVILDEAKMGVVVDLPRDKIHTAKLVLTDKLIAATKPIDTTGVEDIVEDPVTGDVEEKADD